MKIGYSPYLVLGQTNNIQESSASLPDRYLQKEFLKTIRIMTKLGLEKQSRAVRAGGWPWAGRWAFPMGLGVPPGLAFLQGAVSCWVPTVPSTSRCRKVHGFCSPVVFRAPRSSDRKQDEHPCGSEGPEEQSSYSALTGVWKPAAAPHTPYSGLWDEQGVCRVLWRNRGLRHFHLVGFGVFFF